MTQVDFGSLVDDFQDTEQLLRERGQGLLAEAFIQRIMEGKPPPVMFTLDSHFKLLEPKLSKGKVTKLDALRGGVRNRGEARAQAASFVGKQKPRVREVNAEPR